MVVLSLPSGGEQRLRSLGRIQPWWFHVSGELIAVPKRLESLSDQHREYAVPFELGKFGDASHRR